MPSFKDTCNQVALLSRRSVTCLVLALLATMAISATSAQAQPSFITFESGQVRPIALTPDGTTLLAVNTPDNRLEIFSVTGGSLTHTDSIPVGMEPVSVAARTNDEVWVVNHLSDSVSVIDLTASPAKVVATLIVGDEPRDIVFAGTGGNRAFITTAHRGQHRTHSSIAGVFGGGNPADPRFTTAGIDRADVWVFDATSLGAEFGGVPVEILTFFADTPRALAVSDDGNTVYVAAFHSGNQTTVINETVVADGFGAPSQVPNPDQNFAGASAPETGLIVKFDGAAWRDASGLAWSSSVNLDLPDHDVFALNANTLAHGTIFDSVGTILFNMAVNPKTGTLYVSNTEANNRVRFEGPGMYAKGKKPEGEPTTVRGRLHQARISVIKDGRVQTRHLNKHIDYSILPALAGVKDKSIGGPMGMVVSPDGNTLYVASFGSQKIGVFDTGELESDAFVPNSVDHIALSGGGPSGLALQGTRLYVLTRFNNSISVVDTGTKLEVQTLALHNPEPASVVDGRPFLYDANFTSSNGEASCSSCHVGGDMDDLAWDLGNPDDDQKPNNNPMNDEPFADLGFGSCLIQQFLFGNGCTFHPMKGPMTTQSLRGMDLQGPQHWRGDREGDATSSFLAFNAAFPGLVGRETTLTGSDMVAFKDFALQLRYPPNPTRNLDNSLTTIQAQGLAVYNAPDTDQVASCNDCHTLAPDSGFFGGDGRSTFDGGTEIFKVPHLRNMYQKIGMFGEAQPQEVSLALVGNATAFDGPFTAMGDQVRGFGFTHDGSVDTLFRFVSASLFDITNTQQDQVEAFMIAMDTDLAPIVGQQVTLNATNAAVAGPRIDLMLARCDTAFDSKILFDLNGGAINECDLVAKLDQAGSQRGYAYDASSNLFEPDDGGAAVTDAALRAMAAVAGQEITYTAAPPGSGFRMGINRDLDIALDGADNCPSVPNDDQLDTDTDGLGDLCDPTPLPEPGQILTLAIGLLGLGRLNRHRRARRHRGGC